MNDASATPELLTYPAKDSRFKRIVIDALSPADIRINGSRPWDLQVKDERFFKRLIREGDLGLGESYMDGWWECEQIDEMVAKALRAKLNEKFNRSFKLILAAFYAKIFNEGRKARKFEVGEKHYDLSNRLFEKMLDRRMVYTCAYWKDARTLDEAQEAKLELICKKLQLKPGMRLLDIGCGWGGLLKYAAEKYRVEGVGITISKEQLEWARESCKGLPVELRLQDYRDLGEKFERIASIGMFEHVCHKNYRTYMKTAHRCLKDDGLFLLQTMGGDKESIPSASVWIHKYVLPVGEIPSMEQVSKAVEGLFVMEDWHNFGDDYDKTMMAWFENFVKNWPHFKSEYDERFFRMWKFFWLGFAGTFRARWNQLWQIVFSKGGLPGGYRSIR